MTPVTPRATSSHYESAAPARAGASILSLFRLRRRAALRLDGFSLVELLIVGGFIYEINESGRVVKIR